MPTRRKFINQFAIAGTGALMLLKFDALARANDAVLNMPPQISPSLQHQMRISGDAFNLLLKLIDQL